MAEHKVSDRFQNVEAHPSVANAAYARLDMSLEFAKISTNSLLRQCYEMFDIAASCIHGCFETGDDMVSEAIFELHSGVDTLVSSVDTVYQNDIRDETALMSRRERFYIMSYVSNHLISNMKSVIEAHCATLKNIITACIDNIDGEIHGGEMIKNQLRAALASLETFKSGSGVYAVVWFRKFISAYYASL